MVSWAGWAGMRWEIRIEAPEQLVKSGLRTLSAPSRRISESRLRRQKLETDLKGQPGLADLWFTGAHFAHRSF